MTKHPRHACDCFEKFQKARAERDAIGEVRSHVETIETALDALMDCMYGFTGQPDQIREQAKVIKTHAAKVIKCLA